MNVTGCSKPVSVVSSNFPIESVVDKAEDIQSKVKMELYHESDLLFGPGFSICVSGWEPDDIVEVLGYDGNQEKIVIVPFEENMTVSPEGTVSSSLPYGFHRFQPGKWAIVISGRSGNHAHYVEIPRSD